MSKKVTQASQDAEVLEIAHSSGRILLSHDVNTMRFEAEARIADAKPIAGVFLTAQRNPTRSIADAFVLIWAASEAEEWLDRIVFIPF